MLLHVKATADNSQGAATMAQVFSALPGVHRRRLSSTFLIGQIGGTVGLFCEVPAALQATFSQTLLDGFPDCQIETVADQGKHDFNNQRTWRASLRLPLVGGPGAKMASSSSRMDSVADPLTYVLSAVSTKGQLSARVVFTVRPASARERTRERRLNRLLSSRLLVRTPRLVEHVTKLLTHRSLFARSVALPLASRLIRKGSLTEADEQRLAGPLFAVRGHVEITASSTRSVGVSSVCQQIVAALELCLPSGHPGIKADTPREMERRVWWRWKWSVPPTVVLSPEELAHLWHPTTAAVHTATVSQLETRELPPPEKLPAAGEPHVLPLGHALFRGRQTPVAIALPDRRRHCYVVGKTGTGKTTFLTSLITADIIAGRGVVVIDPHGDLVEELHTWIPRHRTNDVVLFDPADASSPIAFNPLDSPGPPHRTADSVLAAFKKMFESWGPRLEHTLGMSLATLCTAGGHSLLSVPRILTDDHFRAEVLTSVDDPVLQSYWRDEFGRYGERFRAEVTAPVLNKAGQLLRNPLLRNVLGQTRTRLDLRQVIDREQVLLINVSKGRLGESGSALLGSLLLTRLEQAALSRADMTEDTRRDTFCYIDEFQNFATDSFATVLSESRKYRFSLTLAHQYLGQLDDSLQAAVFGNVGSLAAFQVGADDGALLADQLGGPVDPQDLLRVPRYHAYLRLLIDGHPAMPFLLKTETPKQPQMPFQRPETVRNVSRGRYGQVSGKQCLISRR